MNKNIFLPFKKKNSFVVEIEFLLRVLPLVAEDEHDPGVELGEGGGHVALPRLVEDGADEPEIEGVARQGEDVSVSPGSVLQSSAGAQLRTFQFLVFRGDFVLHETMYESTNALF